MLINDLEYLRYGLRGFGENIASGGSGMPSPVKHTANVVGIDPGDCTQGDFAPVLINLSNCYPAANPLNSSGE